MDPRAQSQLLDSLLEKAKLEVTESVPVVHPQPQRLKLDDERCGLTHRFAINALDGKKVFYLTCGLYPDGKLGELFITVGREGSLISAAFDGYSAAVSIGLQHGVPLDCFTRKMRHTQFEPSGLVDGAPEAIKTNGRFVARSPFDYLAAYLDWRFPNGYIRKETAP